MAQELQAIRFGYVVEDIQRILYNLISQYFDGTEETLGRRSFDFNDCLIVFNKQRLESEENKPVIAILGERVSSSVDYKKNDPDDEDDLTDFAYEEWINVDKTVYIKLPIGYGGTDLNMSYRTAVRVYGLLHACFASKHAVLAQYGLDMPRLTPSPADISTKEFTVLMGRLKFRARVTVRREDY